MYDANRNPQIKKYRYELRSTYPRIEEQFRVVLVKRTTKPAQYFIHKESLFELPDENIHDIGQTFQALVKRGL